MLSNVYFLAKFRFDTAENEPAKKLQNFANFAGPNHCSTTAARSSDDGSDAGGAPLFSTADADFCNFAAEPDEAGTLPDKSIPNLGSRSQNVSFKFDNMSIRSQFRTKVFNFVWNRLESSVTSGNCLESSVIPTTKLSENTNEKLQIH